MLTKKNRDSIKRIYKMRDQAPDYLAQRAALYKRMDACAEGGHIGLIVEGMDCDCACFSWGYTLPLTSHYAAARAIDRHYDDAEGPMSVAIVPPTKADRHKSTSRDLALEAFEDGHSHIVYYPGASYV